MTKPVIIIAEVGVNHNGDMEVAKQLIDLASDAGADIVKFQTFSADRLVTRTAQKAEYQIEDNGTDETQYQMLSRLELSVDMHKELIAHCKTRNIEFLSTGYDIESVDLLVELGQTRFKIPSGEITNLPYLRHIGSLGKPIVMSTGMSTVNEVKAAIEVLEKAGGDLSQITLLHCTTEYPAPKSDVNLNAMLSLKQLDAAVGYSDHTTGIEVAIAAVAMGAEVIEKHFTIDKNLPGPDHKASVDPEELVAMVSGIRNIELALGDGVKRISASEAKNRTIARKSIVARRPIVSGEKFSEENITIKRPGTGISPMQWDDVIGQVATCNYKEDELIVL